MVETATIYVYAFKIHSLFKLIELIYIECFDL